MLEFTRSTAPPAGAGCDGDWVESCTALVEYPDGTLEILRWSHQQAVVAVGEPRGLPETRPIPGWAAG